MKTAPTEDLRPYLARLKELPFVEEARLKALPPSQVDRHWNALLELRVAGKRRRYLIAHQRTARLNYALMENLIGRTKHEPEAKWILFAPYVTSPMAAYLMRRGVNYVDANGNCSLSIDRDHVAVIDGRRPVRRLEDTRLPARTGYQVYFALLAHPRLVERTVREIAEDTGVSKTAVAATMRLLEGEGIIARTRANAIIIRPTALLDRWLAGYMDSLRPRLLVGYYRTPDRVPADLEERIERALSQGEPTRWAWGGAAAAYRLTKHYRGQETILHLERLSVDLVQRLGLLPARTGPLALLRVPGPLAFDGAVPNTVHPLLIYAELLATGDDRAREAAAEIRDQYLDYLA